MSSFEIFQICCSNILLIVCLRTILGKAINECFLIFQETLTLNLTDNTVNNEIYANNFKGELQGKDQFGKFALVSKSSNNLKLIVKRLNMLSAESEKQKSINKELNLIHFQITEWQSNVFLARSNPCIHAWPSDNKVAVKM